MAGLAAPASGGVLEDYVKKEDGALKFSVEKEFDLGGVKVLNVRLVSQTWQGMEWKHWLSVVVPPVIDDHKKAILMVAGGRNKEEAPTAPEGGDDVGDGGGAVEGAVGDFAAGAEPAVVRWFVGR